MKLSLQFFIIKVIIVTCYSATLPSYDNEDLMSLEKDDKAPSVLAEAKLPLEGKIRKDFAKLHQIQVRRTGYKRTRGGPVFCTFQGKIAMQNSCEQFYMCQRAGTKPRIGICPVNKRFHHQKRMCLKISGEECKGSMCQTTMDKFPDPYARDTYLSCRGMYPAPSYCPEGTIFNDEEKACVNGSALAGFRASYEADQNAEKEEDFHGVPEKPFKANEDDDTDEGKLDGHTNDQAAGRGSAKKPGKPRQGVKIGRK